MNYVVAASSSYYYISLFFRTLTLVIILTNIVRYLFNVCETSSTADIVTALSVFSGILITVLIGLNVFPKLKNTVLALIHPLLFILPPAIYMAYVCIAYSLYATCKINIFYAQFFERTLCTSALIWILLSFSSFFSITLHPASTVKRLSCFLWLNLSIFNIDTLLYLSSRLVSLLRGEG